MKLPLSIEALLKEAGTFAHTESTHAEPSIYGITDGKAIGTYLEHKFHTHLGAKYTYEQGSSARGIDFPGLGVDVKVTRITQPQSSCPFESARQKIYGLGYSLLVFVYDKIDDPETQTGRLDIRHTIYIDKNYTADFQTTSGIRQIIENNGNVDDLIAFMHDRYLPVDEIQATELAAEILTNPPRVGYLTISNALQWRLQYSRAIEKAGELEGVLRIR
ncbi:MAG TPA: restriction endonuclease [Anaerolineae bacterium]|nr:restriction endonuclease [Anaerolineae bacterium]HQK15311.1 restriction endonuclease [Anaerolineae bacterium]